MFRTKRLDPEYRDNSVRAAETDHVPVTQIVINLAPGVEMSSQIIEGESSPPRLAYSESINDLSAYYGSPLEQESLYAISDGRWKLIAHREAAAYKRFELFDLQTDPGEQHDVYAERGDEARRLIQALERLGAFIDDAPKPVMDAATRERLRALGYVE